MVETPKDLTLEDIARMAGVSPATASRVINNRVGLRSKARERVLQAVAETGFQPHAAARSLASQRSSVIGLLIPAPASTILNNPNALQVAEVITQACQEREYLLSLFLLGSDTDERRILPKITRKGFVDGLIVRGADDRSSDPLLATLAASGMPLVSLGHPTNPHNISYVATDNVTAAYHAVTHLLHLGRRRIALLVGSLEPYASQERLTGYRKALAERGIVANDRLIAVGGMHASSAAVQQLLLHNPDALFMPTRMAPDVLRVLHEANLRVPEDIALVGFDDLPLAQQTTPPLTTVRQPMEAMGRKLVGMLLDMIDHGVDPPRHVIFEQELVIRQSCGALHASGAQND